MINDKIFIISFNNICLFPPSLYAIDELSKKFKKIDILSKINDTTAWVFPNNVQLIIPSKSSKNTSYHIFNRTFKKILLNNNYKYLLIYDIYSLLPVFLFRKRLGNMKIWYHSHDPYDPKNVRLFSGVWFLRRIENYLFRYFSIFTLPTKERLVYYNLRKFHGSIFIIPNYPSLARFQNDINIKKPLDIINLVYIGKITHLRGINQIINILSEKISKKKIELTLIGSIENGYKKKLLELAHHNNVYDNLHIIEEVKYAQIPAYLNKSHIGLALITAQSIQYLSGGYSTNKIYEYAGNGLPVIYFNNPSFNRALKKYNWAFQSNLSLSSIKKCITEITSNYQYLSDSAYQAFLNDLNFEISFLPVIKYLNDVEN